MLMQELLGKALWKRSKYVMAMVLSGLTFWCLLGVFWNLLITATCTLPQFSVLFSLVLPLLPKISKNKKLHNTNVVLRIGHSLFSQMYLAAPWRLLAAKIIRKQSFFLSRAACWWELIAWVQRRWGQWRKEAELSWLAIFAGGPHVVKL